MHTKEIKLGAIYEKVPFCTVTVLEQGIWPRPVHLSTQMC